MKGKELIKELPQKSRTINELIRYIDTRNETSASYNIFLGAGASVSSGIQSGVQLVDIWRKEQYLKLNIEHKGEYDSEFAKDWLSKNHLDWYNPQKEYSSLFEKAYDLPRACYEL